VEYWSDSYGERKLENYELQKQVDEWKTEYQELHDECEGCFAKAKDIQQQAVKDTEKKILTGILSNCKMAKEKIVNIVVNEDSGYRLGYIKAIEDYTDFILCVAREKGVEVE
jgi:molecular chaperone GrpE (heat shock protein)